MNIHMHECQGCGNIMTDKDESCKYCGLPNPIFKGQSKQKHDNEIVKISNAPKARLTNYGEGFWIGFFLGTFAIFIGYLKKTESDENARNGVKIGLVVHFSIVITIVFAILLGIITSSFH